MRPTLLSPFHLHPSPLHSQPPFDEGLFNATFCHYTWGVLYHEGKPSQGAKQVYRWEKRDFNDMKFVLKVVGLGVGGGLA